MILIIITDRSLCNYLIMNRAYVHSFSTIHQTLITIILSISIFYLLWKLLYNWLLYTQRQN